MRFVIHGADKKTGREMTIAVDAPDASEAERRALYNDILVSSVNRFTSGEGTLKLPEPEVSALDYRPAELPPADRGDLTPSSEAVAPKYAEVLRGARWLVWLAAIARWAGSAVVVAALAVALIVLIKPLHRHVPFPINTPALWLAAAGLVAAVGLLAVLCGVMISMTSGLTLALRDIARNTFHIAAAKPAAESTEPFPRRPNGFVSVQEVQCSAVAGPMPAAGLLEQ